MERDIAPVSKSIIKKRSNNVLTAYDFYELLPWKKAWQREIDWVKVNNMFISKNISITVKMAEIAMLKYNFDLFVQDLYIC